MGKTGVSASGAGNDTLLMDFGIFNQRRTSMLSAVEKLKFDMRPAEMENKVCGTETMMELMSMWEKVAKTSDNFREFYTGCVDKSLVETADSIYDANEQVANSLNRFGNTNNSFNGAKGTPYTYVDLLANQKPGAVFGIKGIDMQQSGKMDPGFLAAIHGANLQSGTAHLTKVDYLRKDFRNRYNVDSATMARVEQMIAECQSGDTTCLDKLNRYQNLSSADWKNLSDAEYQDFTDLVILNAYAGYVLEHGKGKVDNFDTYKTISEKTVSKMYVNTVDNTQSITVDASLIRAMKSAYNSIGASDTLSYNILSKVEADRTTYLMANSDYPNQNVSSEVVVTIGCDPSGYTSVLVQDACVRDGITAQHNKHFLATSKDYAAEYMQKVRATVKNHNNHGLSDDEMIGMFQSVESINDLRMMENIAKSDNTFKINGKNAFAIDYWEANSEDEIYGYHVKGISDNFSVTLSQMGSIMLCKGELENYTNFVDAAIEASVNGEHDLLFDIASGAGVYADVCSLKVLEDEQGGDNDAELKKTLNAANANYGAFSQLCAGFEYRTSTLGRAIFSNIEVKDLKYDENTGKLSLNADCDKKDKKWFITTSVDNDYNVAVDTKIVKGEEAIDLRELATQVELTKKLEQKKEDIVLDCIVDLTGNVNPLLKDGLTVAKDLAKDSSALKDSTTLIKDGLKGTYDCKAFDKLSSGSMTVLSALSKYEAAVKEYNADMKYSADTQRLETFYSYNMGSDSVGLYDYDTIRKVQDWSDNGISEIVGESSDKTNDEIYNSLREGNDYKKAVVKIIAEDICHDNKSFGYLAKDAGEEDKAKAYRAIEEKSDYTKAQIDNAIRIVVYGEKAAKEDDVYQCVTDIPDDLLRPCIRAISSEDGADVKIWGEI